MSGPTPGGILKRKRATSAVASKKDEDDMKPFWGPEAATLSSQLWMPKGPIQKSRMSWFSTSLLQGNPAGLPTYDPARLDAWLLLTDGGPAQVEDKSLLGKKPRHENPINRGPLKTRKIRVYPANDDQRQLLLKWFGTARWTYNECLKKLQLPNSPYKPNRFGGLREAVVNDGNYATENKWVLETPRTIRQGAYEELLLAYASNFAKKKKTPSHAFDIRPRSRKQPQQSIYICNRNYNKGVIYPTKFGTVPLRSIEPLPERLNHDAHLIRTRLGHYYFCITVDVQRDENQVPFNTPRIAAIDPGVRTPHMLYDPSGRVMAFGQHDIGRIYRLCHHLDHLQSEMSLLPKRPVESELKKYVHRKRWRMRKAWRRASLRIHNLVDEYHKQVVHYLVTNYDIVLLPALETSRLILRKIRKLGSKTARAMGTWAHFRFRQRLLRKGTTLGCKVVVCGEAYTSKTCGNCGWRHEKLSTNEVFKCRECGTEVGRDVNGARNILLKNACRFGFRVEAALGLTPAVVDNRTDAWPMRPQASAMK
jgi:putative transposase